MQVRKSLSRIAAVLLPLSVALCLVGCGKFFIDTNGGGGGGGTSTGNYFYVANGTTASVAGFSIGTTRMANTSNSPYTLGVAPSAIAVTPNGQYIYVASGSGAAIYGYSVASNGSLSLLNDGNALITGVSVSALKVDPSGNWLIAADLLSLARVFSINLSNGLLTQQGTQNLDAGAPNHIVLRPITGWLIFRWARAAWTFSRLLRAAARLSRRTRCCGRKAPAFRTTGWRSIRQASICLLPKPAGRGCGSFRLRPAGR